MGASKDAPLPVRLFEISDAVLLSQKTDTGAVNCRRLAALHCGTSSGFEVILGLLNRIMEVLGVALGGRCCIGMPWGGTLSCLTLWLQG